MPYINKRTRETLDYWVNCVCIFLFKKGEYNYVITRLMHHFIQKHGLNYDTLNDAIGILECAKQEFLRAVVGPYEQKKKEENGSISILDREFDELSRNSKTD